MPTRPSPRSERLGTPKTPAIRSTRDPVFEASLVRVCYGLSGCSPPWTDRTKFPWPTGDFYIQASGGSFALPAAGYDYNSHWTPLLAGLSPAGMAASLAAPEPSGLRSRRRGAQTSPANHRAGLLSSLRNSVRSSVEPELAIDGAQVGGSEQGLVGDPHAIERTLEVGGPECQEFVELRKARGEVILLPDELLQER